MAVQFGLLRQLPWHAVKATLPPKFPTFGQSVSEKIILPGRKLNTDGVGAGGAGAGGAGVDGAGVGFGGAGVLGAGVAAGDGTFDTDAPDGVVTGGAGASTGGTYVGTGGFGADKFEITK
jgi:hypothetical protein